MDDVRSIRALAIVLLVGVVLAACSQRVEKAKILPLKVGVRTIERGEIVKRLYVSGSLIYDVNTIVSAEVSAQVKSILVKDGRTVKKDEILLTFDDVKIKALADQAQANLQRDEATLEFNRSEWGKNLELLKSAAVSQMTYDQKFSIYRHSLQQVDADKAFLTRTLEDLKRTKVRAPIRGFLTERFVEEGDWVGEGGKLFRISDYRKIRLEPFLTDLEVGKLDIKKVETEGIDAEITVDAYPAKVFQGKLTYIQGVAGPNRLFQSRFYLDNPDMLLLQGMYARGSTVLDTVPDVLKAPILALLDETRENESNSCFTVDAEHNARLTRVRIGAMDSDFAEITEGLKAGDVIVVEGKEVIVDGQPLHTMSASQWGDKSGRIQRKLD